MYRIILVLFLLSFTAAAVHGEWGPNTPDTLSLFQESTTSGLGYPFPTALADPLQALFSWTAFPPLVPPEALDDETFPLEDIRSSADDKIWTLRIRPDAQWSDGKQVLAADVKGSLESLVSTRTGSPYAILFRHIMGFEDFRSGKARHLEGLEVLDSLTVQILLTESDPDMARRLSHPASGMLRWHRRNPQHASQGPRAWTPMYGKPIPRGLRPVEWVTRLTAPNARFSPRFTTKGPTELTLSVYLSTRLSKPISASDIPLLITGPVLPKYCPGYRAAASVMAESYSLVLLVIRPSVQEDKEELFHSGFSLDQRLAIARHLTSQRDLLPYTEGFVPAEGFLDNPSGYLESILSHSTLEPIFGLRKDAEIRLFYRSGDLAQKCLARRMVALLSEIEDARAFGIQHASLITSLRNGEFDLALLSLPSMAWTPWERAGIMLGLVNGYLWEPMQPPEMEKWYGLPVNPEEAEALAHRLEGAVLEDAVLVPMGWMRSRLVMQQEAVVANPVASLPWPLESIYSLLRGDKAPQAQPGNGR